MEPKGSLVGLPSLVPILSQKNLAIFLPYFLNIKFNIIFPSMFRSANKSNRRECTENVWEKNNTQNIWISDGK
jgi:hypothetical protein